MKILKYSLVLSTFLLVIACGPAAEDRVKSDARNKIIQDSMTATIKARMAEPLQIINEPAAPQPVAQPTAVATPTVK